jgi:hypothetical protein
MPLFHTPYGGSHAHRRCRLDHRERADEALAGAIGRTMRKPSVGTIATSL